MPRHDREGHYKLSAVCLSVCRMPRHNSRRERPRKNKFGRMEAHRTGNPWTYLDVKRSKVKVTRPINAHTVNAQYLSNGKAYELQTWNTDGTRRPASATSPWPPKSKLKVERLRDASGRCWPISRERNVLSPVHTERVDARRRVSTRQIKLMLKIVSIHTIDARQVICINPKSDVSLSLYVGYCTVLLITINGQNVRVAIELHHQTTSVLNDVTDNNVTDNDVIDSWMNMHTLLLLFYYYITCK